MLLSLARRCCRYVRTVAKCSMRSDHGSSKPLFAFYCSTFHSEATKDGKGTKPYFDYDEDCKLLERLQREELDVDDQRDALKIKKKYLKLLQMYHPDTYINEKNEQRKKQKEEIFLQIYRHYKNFTQQYDHLYKSDFTDESVLESEQERDERLERYKRYSEGKRNDMSHFHKNVEIYILVIILVTFGGVLLVCVYLPFDVNTLREELCDIADSGESAQVVPCFYNPVMKRYEYLSPGYSPPHPHQLYYFYKNNFPELFVDDDLLKLSRFEVVQLPKNRAKKCRLVCDMKTSELIFLKKTKQAG
ncbi:conserved Plasmodium protein, unknown function [Plasmodium knowlesi strain H]|uniref:J domain-containing protein n=3 Tax=Plasmodium knowlesi TaxID=5850 RepID=A0A5K1UHN9_PLAKH|nr:uncharacterized protein PKNH_0205100 [Plasmodium knowlesi strain H]OTN66218.1 Uncharacterized protein PKNOH_S09514400 [Plasmodium knowlesi]CAA9986317.1 conserved protein, unknown function [Plasmodium knowlesi strain H]SBO25554.1 conserved Plasmodium protein, unknown function [Plasmodium knowlesi strain H]SBO28301.1 conserved Plasmodium protein, unknown function [Plasmodium knowlesi strain H]VVS75791.1 conserved protein, unknown function [Plasmodium knowlesi strain H]|eukprot:XP_002257722.1 [Plasmodium knowlesi strain H]